MYLPNKSKTEKHFTYTTSGVQVVPKIRVTNLFSKQCNSSSHMFAKFGKRTINKEGLMRGWIS